MAIQRVAVSNFKSFREVSVHLRRFNVLIGANAAGKTNFVHIFKFLADIVNHGLENAVSIQGGMEFLRNVNLGRSQDFNVQIALKEDQPEWISPYLVADEVVYELSLSPAESIDDFVISHERITVEAKESPGRSRRGHVDKGDSRWSGRIVLTRRDSSIATGFEPEPPTDLPERLYLSHLGEERLRPRVSFLEAPLFSPLLRVRFLYHTLGDLSIYDFDPKVPKKAVPITGRRDLEPDGSNLAIVLKNILADKSRRRSLSNLVRDLLPFVEALQVDKFADRSLLFKLSESYASGIYLPAPLISDGTVGIIALIVALYFDDAPFVVFEEPERNVHPILISKVVNLLREASEKKQIIATTHNPQFVAHAEMDDLLFVSRDKGGFSTITRPAEQKEVAGFLKNEIGISELFERDLLV